MDQNWQPTLDPPAQGFWGCLRLGLVVWFRVFLDWCLCPVGWQIGWRQLCGKSRENCFVFVFLCLRPGKGRAPILELPLISGNSRENCVFWFLRCKPGRGRAAILELPLASGNSGGNSRENYCLFGFVHFRPGKGRAAILELPLVSGNSKKCRPAILRIPERQFSLLNGDYKELPAGNSSGRIAARRIAAHERQF